MTEVMLNASMRSNLLSLQQTQKLQDRTRLRLSTGLKVNSAIDNPSSYYTAISLNNRASDLSALLDTMSQGIQTIRAANEAIETGTALLQQAKAVAEKASESSVDIVAKVNNEAELLAAVENGGTGYIVIESNITLTNQIRLKDGQKLVGDNYFADNNSPNRKLSFDFTGKSEDAIIVANNSIVSNLNIDFIGNSHERSSGVVAATAVKNVTFSNLNITVDNKNADPGIGYDFSSILVHNATAVLEGNINIHTVEGRNVGIRATSNSVLDISAEVNIKTEGENSRGILGESAVINIKNGSKINLNTINGRDIFLYNGRMNVDHSELNLISAQESPIHVSTNSSLYISDSIVNTKGTFGPDIYGFMSIKNSLLNIESVTGRGIAIYSNKALASVNIDGNSQINFKTGYISANPAFHLVSITPNTTAALDIAKGAVININANKTSDALWTFEEDYHSEITKKSDETGNPFIAIYDFEESATKSAAEAFSDGEPVIPDIEEKLSETFSGNASFDAKKADNNSYAETISQYDMLVNDASYKGVNLLQSNDLKINFNEDRSFSVVVKGVDASSKGLGILNLEWSSQMDIFNSVKELENAINQLRSFSTEFGNYYAIVTTREDFTKNLINVLTEGADKLTLADMNEESANMLALQTRQQLAVNSLSLASSAAQSVLRLF